MSKLSIVVPVYYNEDTLMDLYQDMQAKILGKNRGLRAGFCG